MIPKTTDAYAAGVVDSDGCITIKRRKHAVSNGGSAYFQLVVVVSQVENGGEGQTPSVLALLHRTYGGHLSRQGKGDRLPMWNWTVASAQAHAFLVRLRPFIVGKQEQVEIALAYRREAIGRGRFDIAESYYWKMRATKNYQGGSQQ